MTKPERVLALAGIGVIASAVLLVSYVTHSNADSQPNGCEAQRARLDQTLDQVRFATSAQHAVASALEYSDRSREAYYDDITAMRRQLENSNNASARRDVVQASVILSDQEGPITQARAIAAEAKTELSSGVPLVNEASQDLRQGDCSALSLTMAQSGWPKDHLLAQLAAAARLNSTVSDRLDSALSLITRAQRSAR